jgi:hypothetical protein
LTAFYQVKMQSSTKLNHLHVFCYVILSMLNEWYTVSSKNRDYNGRDVTISLPGKINLYQIKFIAIFDTIKGIKAKKTILDDVQVQCQRCEIK